jgi:hypothetical protein
MLSGFYLATGMNFKSRNPFRGAVIWIDFGRCGVKIAKLASPDLKTAAVTAQMKSIIY